METVGGRTVTWNPAVDPETGPYGRIIEELRIGAVRGEGPDVFGDIAGLAVSSGGRIAVLDGQVDEVRVFRRDGTHLFTVGRSGSGPGEFQTPVAVHYDGHDRLWVVDPGNQRYHVFDGSGEYVRSSRRVGGMMLGDNSGRYVGRGLLDPSPHVTPGGQLQTLYTMVDSTGETTDTLPPVDQGSLSRVQGAPGALAPFISRQISAPAHNGNLWLAATDAYTVYRRTPQGDTVLVAEVEVGEAELTTEQQASIDSVLSQWRGDVDRELFRPQFVRTLTADDEGRVFVEPVLPDVDGRRMLDLFDRQGRLLARLVSGFPFDARPVVVGGELYAVTVDELDVPHVVRGRIELTGGE